MNDDTDQTADWFDLILLGTWIAAVAAFVCMILLAVLVKRSADIRTIMSAELHRHYWHDQQAQYAADEKANREWLEQQS